MVVETPPRITTQVAIGERLRLAREQLGIPLEEASARTKIHSGILNSLEHGQSPDRLGIYYVRAFVKQYGAFLKVDVSPWLHDLKQAHLATLAPPPKPEGELVTQSTPTITKIPPSQPRKEPRATSWSMPKVSIPKVSLPKVSLPKIPWAIDWKRVQAIAPKLLAVVVALYLVVQVLSAIGNAFSGWKADRAERRAAKAGAVVKTPAAEQAAQASVSEAPFVVAKGTPLTLTVMPKRDVWMRVKADDETIFQNVLTAGTAERWKASNKFDLWVGDAEALALDLNGHDLGSPGRGVQKNIVIDHKGLHVN